MTAGPETATAIRRPRIKPEHQPYRTTDGHVRIGSVIYGIGAEIEDPNGWIWTLTEAMDGTRAPEGIITVVRAEHPDVPPEDIRQAMADLREAGFLEDAGATPPPGFGEREQHRYGRGVTLLRWMDLSSRVSAWDTQQRLRQARVLLIGVGGTGGFAAHALVASGVGHLHVVEPDIVELSNLNRQPLFREDDIGTPKLDTALVTLRALNSDVTVTGEQHRVRDVDDFAALLAAPTAGGRSGERRGYDLVALAADHPPEIRRWANRACLDADVAWVEAGYHGPLVSVGVHVPGQGPCWRCLRDGEMARLDLRLAPGQDEEAASPRMSWNPVNAVTAGLSGSLMAHAAMALLTGAPPMRPGFRFGINLMALADPVHARFPRRKECPDCGRYGQQDQP